MAFGITPASAPADLAQAGEFLQLRKDGVNVGDRKVAAIDIVGPNLTATRGWGLNAHVVTIRRSVPAPSVVIGWHDPVQDQSGVAAHANSGTGEWDNPLTDESLEIPFYAGVVGYTGGVVVWSMNWAPTGFGEPAPTITDMGGGVVRVNWPATAYPLLWSIGEVTLTATVDGVPTAAGEGVVMVATNAPYTGFAWGPEP